MPPRSLRASHDDDRVLLAELVEHALQVVGILHPNTVEDEAVLVRAVRHLDDTRPGAVLVTIERDALVGPAGEFTGDPHILRLRRLEHEAHAAGHRLGSLEDAGELAAL